jgi:hypothetical protein
MVRIQDQTQITYSSIRIVLSAKATLIKLAIELFNVWIGGVSKPGSKYYIPQSKELGVASFCFLGRDGID